MSELSQICNRPHHVSSPYMNEDGEGDGCFVVCFAWGYLSEIWKKYHIFSSLGNGFFR